MIDHWSEYVLEAARRLLSRQEQFSLNELYEYLDGEKKPLLKHVTLRGKLRNLVEAGLLSYIQGRGRTPSYYFLPKSKDTMATSQRQDFDYNDMTDEEFDELLSDILDGYTAEELYLALPDIQLVVQEYLKSDVLELWEKRVERNY